MEKQIEAILFRRNSLGIYEYLLLKRALSRGGFWQPVTGGVKDGETEKEAAIREINEETGANSFLRIIEQVYVFNLEENGIEESVFGFEVPLNFNVNLNCNVYLEHDEFGWYTFEEAQNKLKWPENKEGLKRLNEIIQ